MSEQRPLPRTALSPQEWDWRSRLTRLVVGQPLLKGSLLQREPRLRQLYVPKQWKQRVRQWVANHHRIRDLLSQVSDLYWQKVRQR